jgi:hypothetical protein
LHQSAGKRRVANPRVVPARDSGSQPSHIHSMEEGKEGRPIREEEARYLVIQIVNQHPKLDAMLVTARMAGRTWAEALKMLQEATTFPG